VVSTHLKNISQNENLPQIGVKIKIVETTTQFLRKPLSAGTFLFGGARLLPQRQLQQQTFLPSISPEISGAAPGRKMYHGRPMAPWRRIRTVFLEESSLVPHFGSPVFGLKTRKLRFNQHLQLQRLHTRWPKMHCHQDAIGRPKLSAKATVSSQLNQVWPRRAAKTSWQNHAILWDKSHHNTNKSGPWTSESALFAEITWFPLNSVLRGSSHSLKHIEIL